MRLWGIKREAAADKKEAIVAANSLEKDVTRLVNREKLTDEKNHVLLSWNIAAIAVVTVPLFGFTVAQVVDKAPGWNMNRKNAGVGVALGFAYSWGLVLFGAVVFFGNRVLRDKNNKNLRTLLGGLFVFTNLSILCAILAVGLVLARDSASNGGWTGHFSSAIILSFVLWTVFGIVFTIILFRQKMKSKLMFSATDNYQRFDNDSVA